MLAGSLFVQNFLLWSEAGYFDVASTLKPLTHLWSLAIEEQFYLFYPVLILVLWRLRLNLFYALLILFVFSFGYNVYLVGHDDVALFYSPLTRAWELLIGSLLAYGPYLTENRQKQGGISRTISRTRLFNVGSSEAPATAANHVTSFLGLILILIAVFGIRDGSHYPGWRAILPVLGSFLLLRAGAAAWVNKYLLAHPVMVFIGAISYPLYLWHWPIISFVHILVPDASVAVRLAAMILSVVLAWLTYRFIEVPVRFGNRELRLVPATLCVGMIAVAGIGLSIVQFQGMPERPVNASNRVIDTGKALAGPVAFIQKGCGLAQADVGDFFGCLHDTRGLPKIALYGDSKAGAFSAGLLSRSTPETPWLFIGGNGPRGGTVPVINHDFPAYAIYTELTEKAFDALLKSEADVVVLYTATRALFQLGDNGTLDELPDSPLSDEAYNGLNRAVDVLVRGGKKVVLMVDNPTLPDPKQCIGRVTEIGWLNTALALRPGFRCHIPYDEQLKLSEKYRVVLDKVSKNYPDQVRIFDPTRLLCNMTEGQCTSMLNGRLMYSNTDHISEYASLIIADKLIPFVEGFSRNEPADDRFELQRYRPK